MAYIDDKLDIVDRDKKPDDDNCAKATLKQLCRQRGCVGGEYWMIEKKAPEEIRIIGFMDGKEQIWKKNGEQPGIPYKDKQYKKTN